MITREQEQTLEEFSLDCDGHPIRVREYIDGWTLFVCDDLHRTQLTLPDGTIWSTGASV